VLLMTGIFPNIAAGGVEIRTAAGAPTNPPGVENAYAPLAQFITTCIPTALPSDCEARIEPRQINAIVSELVALAECMDPNGPWNCASLNNLCAAFSTWAILHMIHVGDVPPTVLTKNQLWWETDTGYTFIYYDDGNTKQWVQIAGGDLVMDKVSIVGSGTNVDPYQVGLVDCGTY